MSQEASLGALYRSALESGAQAASLSALSNEQNAIVQLTLASFRALTARVEALGLFSDNERWDEIPTTDALYMLIPYAYADVLARQRTTTRLQRMRAVQEADTQIKMFVKRVQQYKILADEDKKLYKKGIFSILEPLKHRDLKIRQLRMETELRDQIKAIRDYRDPASASKSLDNDLSLVASLIADRSGGESIYNNPSSANVKAVRDDEELLRQMTLLAIRLCWMKAHGAISLLEAERDLLKKAPPDEGEGEELAREKDEKERQRQRQLQRDKDMSWRLDPTRRGGGPDGRGPLLDPRGRPLRPFTITSSSTANRVRLQQEVYQADHRLPTMSIEDYLEEERRRGNIISGGGPSSGQGPTSDELLQLRTEEDGTMDAAEAQAEQVRKTEYWALYRENHRRGEGNTMNRG